ncbi:thiamine-phosphate kinase [Altererythrobacter sp. ZODW24]|uniref:thiamine-phosphate kinase n=1 Tax=Altererythrobacter sp. ZODW24 TaxID=2185142 RepID=UPI000DF74660|nr:thiamine-phosphate kinase [Altererythrobacter sp. ZODW24]
MSGELDFIAALRGIATHPAARGLTDDAAVLKVGGETLVLTHDMMVEGVHFLSTQDMADVAWKLVATNMSDLAAKGATPVGALLGHMLGGDDDRFVDGLREALAHYNCPLLGGDTVSGGSPHSFGLTAIGRATHSPVPSRADAKPGDGLYLLGTVGGAMMGFEALRGGLETDTSAYRRPVALLSEGQALAPHVSAMMDVSDGLLLDASRMARASGVSLEINRERVPLGCSATRRDDALRWGDDYALLFTASGELPDLGATKIGYVVEAADAPILLDGEMLSEDDGLGYQHG